MIDSRLPVDRDPPKGIKPPDNSRQISVPLDISPGVVQGDHSALTVARRAYANLHEGWTKLQQAAERVKDPDKLAKEAKAHADRVARTAQADNDACWAAYRHLDAEMDRAVQPNAGDPMGGEIRAHVSAQDSPFKAAGDFVRDQEARVVAAILNAPAAISGLTKDEHRKLKALARAEFRPIDHAALQQLERLAKSHGDYMQRFRTMADERIARWTTGDDDALKELFGDG